MLKITFDDAQWFDDTQWGDDTKAFQIAENDRGGWSLDADLSNARAAAFTGYGGENTLHFHLMDMQDGSIDFVVVHSSVDNPAKVAQKRVAPKSIWSGNTYAKRNAAFNEAIACLLAQVGAYDPFEVAP